MKGCKGACDQGRKDCPHPVYCIGKVSGGRGPVGTPATPIYARPWLWAALGGVWGCVIVAGLLYWGK